MFQCILNVRFSPWAFSKKKINDRSLFSSGSWEKNKRYAEQAAALVAIACLGLDEGESKAIASNTANNAAASNTTASNTADITNSITSNATSDITTAVNTTDANTITSNTTSDITTAANTAASNTTADIAAADIAAVDRSTTAGGITGNTLNVCNAADNSPNSTCTGVPLDKYEPVTHKGEVLSSTVVLINNNTPGSRNGNCSLLDSSEPIKNSLREEGQDAAPDVTEENPNSCDSNSAPS